MTSAREDVLGRVRTAMAGADSHATVPRGYRRTGTIDRLARSELLCARIGDYRAEVRRLLAPDLRGAIRDVFAAHSARRVGIPAGLPAEWRPLELELVEDSELSPAALDRLEGVLTGCTLAIAETGTIVLSGGPAEGRRALTLVPDLHVCIVAEEQIVELVPEALAALAPLVAQERRPLTFISGPSATSDIEMNRVEGVHGPRRLVVLVSAPGPS